MFDLARYRVLLAAVSQASDSASKGKSLEDLLVYLLSQVPGVVDMERNALNAFATEELDIALIHTPVQGGMTFLPEVLLVECKNWSVPVDSVVVSYFASRVRNRGCRVGILVAAAGLTGDAVALTAAYFESAIALARDGIQILVITLDDLCDIESASDFVALLRRRLLQLVCSGTYIPL